MNPIRLPGVFYSFLVILACGSLTSAVRAQEWLEILKTSLKSEYSQQRHDGLKQVDASTVKGLRALWKVLELQSRMVRAA